MALIKVTLDGITIQEMDESLLVKKEGGHDNDNETATWVEYYFGEKLVHRSASVTLKKAVISTTEIGEFK